MYMPRCQKKSEHYSLICMYVQPIDTPNVNKDDNSKKKKLYYQKKMKNVVHSEQQL